MGLTPEFFVFLGIVIFLAMSLLSAYLDDDLPSRLQHIFQIAAIAGLGEILTSQVFINLTRTWVSIAYLASALSTIICLNFYPWVSRRTPATTSAFAAAATVPVPMRPAAI